MNKWITMFGLACISFVFAYTIPITLRNPSGSNLTISGVLILLILGGLWTLTKDGKGKPKKQKEQWIPA